MGIVLTRTSMDWRPSLGNRMFCVKATRVLIKVLKEPWAITSGRCLSETSWIESKAIVAIFSNRYSKL